MGYGGEIRCYSSNQTTRTRSERPTLMFECEEIRVLFLTIQEPNFSETGKLAISVRGGMLSSKLSTTTVIWGSTFLVNILIRCPVNPH